MKKTYTNNRLTDAFVFCLSPHIVKWLVNNNFTVAYNMNGHYLLHLCIISCWIITI